MCCAHVNISHVNRAFLKLQQESRSGRIGSVDNKLAKREQHTAQHQERFLKHAKKQLSAISEHERFDSSISGSVLSGSNSSDDDEFVAATRLQRKRRRRMGQCPKHCIFDSISCT